MRIKKSTPREITISLRDPDDESNNDVDFRFPVGGEEHELAPLFSGPLWSAIIWERSVLTMCNYLERHATEFESKQVVELGCGLGVPGIVAGFSCKASHVWLTDRAEDLQTLEKALAVGQPTLSRSMCDFKAVPFDWSQAPSQQIRADVIIAVECVSADVYGRESLHWLLTAIRNVVLRSHSVTVFLCSARRTGDGLDTVLEELAKLVKDTTDIQRLHEYTDLPNSDVELYRIQLSM